ncbi:glycosyltransferase family 4 protein [Prosthecobacter sp. SYSU 5D2]|uniref:glycosyltransferase family 4 protein n=1 Tax=Prosthecobacter sp. SYSU 5D2 TaxID=3134134 RepID=UPI0031FE7ED3
MTTMSRECRVLVVQNGARHNYAVPLALARHEMLSGFYTDACGNQGLGKVASMLSGISSLSRRFSLLKNRKVPESVLPFTRTFPISAAMDSLADSLSGAGNQGRMLGMSMIRKGLGEADLLYSSFGWSPIFLAHARRKGLRVVTEFYVRPSYWKVHRDEYARFPDWELQPPYMACANPTERLRMFICELSDEVIAPTQAVKEDIVAEGLFPAAHIHVVPYGIDEAFFSIKNRPDPGSVLFVGSCTLMKGIHYLAMAAQRIAQGAGMGRISFTAAGDVSDVVRHKPLCSAIRFLGRVPRVDINQLYETADVLAFPTLSDSFGAVILEAMAAGIPVICSPYCADIVEHGVSGLVVEPRDSEAWAQAILTLTHDRELRSRMAMAAKSRALQYTRDCHARILASALSSIHGRLSEA